MRIIDAKWEKRNIGVTTNEVIFDRTDSIETIKDKLQEIENKEYVVIKVPYNEAEIASFIQNHGYKFIESLITVKRTLDDFELKKKYKGFKERISVYSMNKSDIEKLYQEIDYGIFKTDRVYLDSFFSKSSASQRYRFWIEDIVTKGNRPCKVLFGDKEIGFFSDTEIGDGIIKGVLGGLYHGYEGMGAINVLSELMYLKENGKKSFETNVSSNNLPVIRIYEDFGLKITDYYNVFVKHIVQ